MATYRIVDMYRKIKGIMSLAWGAYDERKTCRNALPIDHRITKAISLTKKKKL